jgi:ABC-2 type transport system permease protein
MLTVFKHSLSRSRGGILGWGLSLGFFAYLMVLFFDTIAADIETFSTLLDAYPPELMAFFGEAAEFTTPEGFLSLEFFSFMPLVLGVYAVIGGAGLLASDEESGTLDLLLAQPVSRSSLFWGRLLSWVAVMVLILTIVWSAVMISANFYLAEYEGIRLAGGLASLGALMSFFFGLALLLSMVLPSRRLAAMGAGIFLVAAFFVSGLSAINDTLSTISEYLPMYYYQGDTWSQGFEINDFAILIGFSAVFALLAWWRFGARDIRVGGEGGFKIKLPKFLSFGRSEA